APKPAPAPLTVTVNPFVYETPCSQDFLVDSEPDQVGPPATEPQAKGWAAANGAVSANQQVIALTIQGTGPQTVVLNSLNARIVTKDAPLAWNVYGMGAGCGGDVDTKSFTVDLDEDTPAVDVKGGQRKFPYSVSESDPEVFYVTATTKNHDVRWDLSLNWSSGDRSGTLRIDNDNVPFRTSADDGRDASEFWDYPLGGNKWEQGWRSDENSTQYP
ncbi:MAG TPA: transcriptional regulator, partial [Streptomyces sp.]